MPQKNGVLTREESRISFIAAGRTTMQEDYVIATERGMPVNTIEQTRIFEVEEKSSVGRTTPRFVSTLVDIIRWLNHVGSGKIDDSRLRARPDIPYNFRIKSIGL